MDLPHFPAQAMPALEACVIQASERYDLSPLLIESILWAEGGSPGKNTAPNRNGTYDIGPMQVNSIWLEELNSRFGLSEALLRDSICTNVYVGSWILKKYIIQHNGDMQKGVMAYNAGSRLKNGLAYARKVIKHWHRLYNEKVLSGKGKIALNDK